VTGYPRFKLFLNRLTNHFLRFLFHVKLNDFTNAFKATAASRLTAAGRSVAALQPHRRTAAQDHRARLLLDRHPHHLRGRRHGTSKLKLKEMGSRYLFITLYCWLEKYFSRGDYKLK